MEKYTNTELVAFYKEKDQRLLTEENLRQLLKFEIHEAEPDMEMIIYVNEELEKLGAYQTGVSEAEKLIVFHNIMAKVDKEEKTKKVRKISQKLTIAASLLLVFFTTTNIVVYATFGFSLVSLFKVKDKVAISADTIAAESYELVWLPKDFSFKENYISSEPYGTFYQYVYYNNSNNEEEIILQIQEYDNMEDWTTGIETNENLTIVSIDNNVYYRADNYDKKLVIWYSENKVYTLFGTVPHDLLEKIIKNNY